MPVAKTIPLVPERLTPHSRQTLADLLAWQPGWLRHCAMEERDHGCDLAVDVPSPAYGNSLLLSVWYAAGGTDLSLSLGAWHTHQTVSLQQERDLFLECPILDGVRLIVDGELVAYSYAGDLAEQECDLLWLRSRCNLEEVLTSPDCRGSVQLFSWSGRADRALSLDDLKDLDFGSPV